MGTVPGTLGMRDDLPELTCPYCGEPAQPQVDEVGPPFEEFVEDCAVCCRPWTVRVSRDGESVSVDLLREDE